MRLRVLFTLVVTVFSTSVGVIAAGPSIASASSKSCYSTCPSSASLSASSREIVYGNEQTEVFSVKVTPRIPGVSGVPTGTVDIKTGWTTLCSITLSGGAGSCSLSASELKASHRPYLIIGRYSGDSSFWKAWTNLVIIQVDSSTPPPPPPPPPHKHHHWPWWWD